MQEDPVNFRLGLRFGGKELKGRSVGGWRSGRQRSEKCWRRGHSQRVSFIPCVPISYVAPSVPMKTFSGIRIPLVISGRGPQALQMKATSPGVGDERGSGNWKGTN